MVICVAVCCVCECALSYVSWDVLRCDFGGAVGVLRCVGVVGCFEGCRRVGVFKMSPHCGGVQDVHTLGCCLGSIGGLEN